MGKGSTQRKVDRDKFNENFDRIFNKPASEDSTMGRYLITWSSGIGGVNESSFDDYREAMEFLADCGGNASFTTLVDPDDARDEQWYDEQ